MTREHGRVLRVINTLHVLNLRFGNGRTELANDFLRLFVTEKSDGKFTHRAPHLPQIQRSLLVGRSSLSFLQNRQVEHLQCTVRRMWQRREHSMEQSCVASGSVS